VVELVAAVVVADGVNEVPNEVVDTLVPVAPAVPLTDAAVVWMAVLLGEPAARPVRVVV